MTYLVPVRLRIEKDKVTRITRTLKGEGHFIINKGQAVSPEEIIGSATISSGFRTINLATKLAVSPNEVEKYLVKKIGQRVYKGELLAYKTGWLLGRKKEVIAPADGNLDFLDHKTGELKISFFPKKIDLPAGVFGIVEEVDEERGQVIIKTQVSHIHGLLGSGRSRDGMLHFLGKNDDLIDKSLIEAGYDQRILVGGSLLFKDAIFAAVSEGINGVITGGINAEDYRVISGGRIIFPKKMDNDIGISLVVCEGFGSVPIGDDIFELLAKYAGKFIFIDGNKALISLPSFSSSSLMAVKRTALPKLQPNNLTEDYTTGISELKVGLKVRVVGNSYLGVQGNVIAIDNSFSLLPSGLKTCLATVETARRKIQVPVANLEIIM